MRLLLICFFAICIHNCTLGQRVYIYTHNGAGYVHENISTSVQALMNICKKNHYSVDTGSSPAFFKPENLKKYQCIIFSNTNNEAFDSPEERSAFEQYIKKGGGYMGIHSATGSERQWPWFWAMQGGKFVRHPVLQSFNIKVIDSTHPATRMLDSIWHWEDEPYYIDNFNPDIHVLLAADLNTINDTEKDKYPGTVFGHYIPLSWCHVYDGGREFYTALGHKKEYYQDPVYLAHLEGGLKWVLQKDKKGKR